MAVRRRQTICGGGGDWQGKGKEEGEARAEKVFVERVRLGATPKAAGYFKGLLSRERGSLILAQEANPVVGGPVLFPATETPVFFTSDRNDDTFSFTSELKTGRGNPGMGLATGHPA